MASKIDLEEWAKESTEPDPEYVKLLKNEVRSLNQRLNKRIAIEQLVVQAVKETFSSPPKFKFPKLPKTKKKGRVEIPALHISDTQIGKITDHYDTDIAKERIGKLSEKVAHIVDIHRSYADINEMRIWLGGDIVEGENIFPHQAHLIDSSVFDQAVKNAPRMLADLIVHQASRVDKVKVKCVVGNHGRPGGKYTPAHPRTNWDRVCYETLKLMLEPYRDRIEVCIAEPFWAVDYVWDWGNLIVHGDQISGGGGGFPSASTAKKAVHWARAHQIPAFDNLWFGHFHTYTSGTVNDIRFFANGTTESDNDFALEKMAAAGHPCQRLAFFDQDYGVICDYPVFLEKEGVIQPFKKRMAKAYEA